MGTLAVAGAIVSACSSDGPPAATGDVPQQGTAPVVATTPRVEDDAPVMPTIPTAVDSAPVSTADAPPETVAASIAPTTAEPSRKGALADLSLPTVDLGEETAWPDTGMGNVQIRLTGRCAFAVVPDGTEFLLVFRTGLVSIDYEAEEIIVTRVSNQEVRALTDGQTVTLGGISANGLDSRYYVTEPDPTCVRANQFLVAGVG